MCMRYLTYTLLALLVLIQYPLWWGQGGWFKVRNYEQQLADRQVEIRQKEIRNAALLAEINDPRASAAAIEERARFDLGMIKPGEIFIRSPRRTPQR